MGRLKKRPEVDRKVELWEAAQMTGYSLGWLRICVYKGDLQRYSEKSNEFKSDGKRKRGPKILVSSQEVFDKFVKPLLRSA